MSQLISSCYAYTWDIKMDWGLLDRNAPVENRYLREEIVYSSGVSAVCCTIVHFLNCWYIFCIFSSIIILLLSKI